MNVVIDRTFGSAELFSAEHRTFFTATFHIFVLLNDPHVTGVIVGLYVKKQKRMPTEPKLDKNCHISLRFLFVC